MIDLYYWTTPNGHKISIFLEEAGLEYRTIPIHIGRGDQFGEAFLKISPNNKIPAIVDHNPVDGGAPLSLFESGAILEYLAEKTGKFLSKDLRQRWDTLQWLYWQMGGFGPMLGQNHHFKQYAPEKINYAIDRYVKESERLYGVLDDLLADRDYMAGEYSIADMATYPWAKGWEKQGQDIETLPNVKRWLDAIGERPAVQRAYALADEISQEAVVNEDSKSVLFGQGRRPKD
ncbi:thiol:disulfide oxidoreductase [Marinobacter sp. R17]|uniref:glutathione S-transferase N-terminal domain-containing protein n=1 Tax=Marinobacter sp. R17 TaxID=2484250 RepID=UPI000F4BB15E|nr:glutathione S-transferase N-terminal domain-containing protein [Marinobacter sp. R17]ROT96019.1 thiol:disulfide oxidoreductase [Marinobacter sp. R17]